MDTSNLKAKANEIKNETIQGRNTATRVGTLFNDIIDALNQVDSAASSVTLNQPLSAINTANMGAGSIGNLLQKKSSGWGYTTISALSDEIKNDFVTKNYFTQYSGATLNLPLSAINSINANPTASQSILFYNNGWGYASLPDAISSIINNNPTIQQIIQSKVTVNPILQSGTHIATINGTNIFAPAGGGSGSEPAAYLKSASVSGNTLTLTKKDNTTVVFTPSGGSSGGSTVSISDLLSTGPTIAKITIDGTPYSIKAPAGGEGGGTQYVENPYDDSWIQGAIDGAVNTLDNDLQGQINTLNSDLSNILTRKRDDIIGIINDVLDGKNFIDGWQAGWNENLKAYLISVGVLGENGVDKGWAYLEVLYNSLTGRVAAIERSIGDGGEINLETLEANLKLYIDQELEAAIAQLEANYALTDEDKTVLKWLSAGLYAEASANKALAQVFATAEQYTALSNTVTQINTATSGLTTRVQQLENGDWVASSSLGSLVQKEIVDSNTGKIKSWLSQAGVVTENSLESALAGLSATLSNTYALKDSLNSYATTAALAGLTATVNDINGKYVARTSLGSEIKNMITDSEGHVIWEEIVSTAGLTTTADLTSATANLMAKNEFTAAAIVAAVNGASSSVTIDADHINLTGEALAGYFSTDTTLTSLTNTGLEFSQRGGIGQVGVTSIGYDGLTVAFTNSSWGGGNSACAITPSGVSISYSGQSVSLGINSANGYLTVSNDIEVPGITIGQGGDTIDLVAWMDYVNGYINEGDFVMDSLIVRGAIKTGNYTGTANAQFTTNDGKLVLVQNGIIIGVTQQG